MAKSALLDGVTAQLRIDGRPGAQKLPKLVGRFGHHGIWLGDAHPAQRFGEPVPPPHNHHVVAVTGELLSVLGHLL